MENKSETIKNHCKRLRLPALCENLDQVVTKAQKENLGYLEFANQLIESEIKSRMDKDQQRRTKQARLPLDYNLEYYDYAHQNGLEPRQLNQLRELHWVEQNYNLVLMGPSGAGKTYIAAGLCFDAVQKGYMAYFMSMEDLIRTLKLKEMTRTAKTEYKRIIKANLLVIDDVMMFPIEKQDALAFFNLINQLHNQSSIIVTTNKSPKQWTETLNDQVLTTALLDRLLYRCEVIKLTGSSYRMNNRKTIFEDQEIGK